MEFYAYLSTLSQDLEAVLAKRRLWNVLTNPRNLVIMYSCPIRANCELYCDKGYLNTFRSVDNTNRAAVTLFIR